MEINGKVIKVLPLLSGVSKSGKQWSKQEFVLETFEAYPKQVCLGIFNPGQNVATPNENDQITASIDVESRSFVGKDGVERWMTDVRAWKIVPYDPTVNAAGFAPQAQQPAAQPAYAPQPQQQAYAAPQQAYAAPQQQYAPQQAPQFAPPQYAAPQQPQPSGDLPF